MWKIEGAALRAVGVRALLQKGLKSSYFEAMRMVLTGEPLYPADVKRWMEVFGERVRIAEHLRDDGDESVEVRVRSEGGGCGSPVDSRR